MIFIRIKDMSSYNVIYLFENRPVHTAGF